MESEGQHVESRVDNPPVASTSEPSPQRFSGSSGAAGTNRTTLMAGAGRPLPKRFVRQQVLHPLCGSRHAAVVALMTNSHCGSLRYGKHAVQVPDAILKDEALKDAISVLPVNYNFEVDPYCTADASGATQ